MPYLTSIERGRIPVVMCTWNRIERLPRTLEMLGEQEMPVALYVWNNNRRAANRLDELATESPIPMQIVHSSRNIGSFGRFYVARELSQAHDAVLFIDDDQDFGPSMLTDQLLSFEPESLAGWWAFRYRAGAHRHGERDRVEAPMELADYVGVGGMVADTSIFRDPGLFECPRRYWFIDDMWLSYYARHVRGWALRRSHAEFSFAADGLDLDVTLSPMKTRMFRYLKRHGWNVAA